MEENTRENKTDEKEPADIREAYVARIDIKDGIDYKNPKIIETLIIKPLKLNDYQYDYEDYHAPHSCLFRNKLLFYYDKENLAVIDPGSLKDYKTIKVWADAPPGDPEVAK